MVKKYPVDKHQEDPKGENVPRVPLDKEKIKEQLIKYGGNITMVAKAMKCARQSITRLVNTNPDIKAILEEAREITVDDIEDTFLKRAKSGDTTALIFFLKTRGRERGYDQDYRGATDFAARKAIEFALNNSRNPAEKNPQS